MHFMIVSTAILYAYKRADLKNYRKYLPTMMFMPFVNLTYQYLFQSNQLWEFQADILASNRLAELAYTMICYPLVILVYLSKMPDTPKKMVIHTVKWILIFIAIEFMLYLTGRITFYSPWCIWCSLGFYMVMFPIIYLHYKNPLYAYFLVLMGAIVALGFLKVTF